ncbi:MAG TPA: ATP-binding cassette domain-containing protein [Candidatus Pseudogracilibacillus intestinigallinarum]|uniref:ATP-binding cassette domain-containing protein n=1 Tax=Candidatus Pseudogracilibacillus intestinigallinarum TaxID=2838742 RepID=A0A9D1PMS6_9BACI|nr:ATP-binding cassette domain-containing protein [Candidatus Pseudogracilibacillus intestinigallinarum]
MLTIDVEKRLPHKTLQITCTIGNEIIAVIGPSGTGKTTFLNMIAGIVTPDNGYIKFRDQIFTQDGKSSIPTQQRKVGYVFQDYALFPHKTVWENIAYSMQNENRTQEWIRALHMEHLLDKYPREISGGEKQRTALLRAYAMEPQILLLDEPFSALDERTKETSYTQLRTLHEQWKIPVIFVTHNPHEVKKIANRVYRLEDTTFVEEPT